MDTKLGFIYFTYWRVDNDILFKACVKNFRNIIFFDLRNIFPELKQNNDTHPFSAENLPNSAISFNTIKEFDDYLKSNNIIVVNGFGEQKLRTWRLSYFLSKNKVPVISFQDNSGLRGSVKSVSGSVNSLKSFFSQLNNKAIFFIYLQLLKFGIQSKYDTYFISGNLSRKSITKYSEKYNEIVNIHSKVYSEFNNLNLETSEKYIVFLDIAMPFMVDFKEWGMEAINPKDYYKKLNTFFLMIEEVTGQEVVICAHPQFQQSNKDYFDNDRKIVWFKTGKYVRQASLVVTHYTNAIQHAILNKKPILLLDDESLNPYIRSSIGYCMENLGLERIMYVNTKKSTIKSKISKTKESIKTYDKFINDYLLDHDNREFSTEDILVDKLRHKYGLL
jgi:hypothetical protein